MIEQAELLWGKIVEIGLVLDNNFKESLNLQEGATEADFQLLENTLGVTVPIEVKSFYQVHNGQIWGTGTNSFVRNLLLSPISEIIDDWKFLQEEFDPSEIEPEIGIEIKPYLWNSKWIPIATNGGGDYLCIDTDPSEDGVIGQVLYFWHDWGSRSIVAKNLFEFLTVCLNEDNEV